MRGLHFNDGKERRLRIMNSYPGKRDELDDDGFDDDLFEDDLIDPEDIPFPSKEDLEVDDYLERREKKRRQRKRRKERHDKYSQGS